MPTVQFSPARFLKDAEKAAAAIGAPFSGEMTRRVLDAYEEDFITGGVLWKTTDRPGDNLTFRFFSTRNPDIPGIAMRAGLLDRHSKVAPLVESWSALYDGAPSQHGDFDACRGLAKTWVHLGISRPVEEILKAAVVPETLRGHAPVFRELNLRHVLWTGVDYRHDTVNLYFHLSGPVTAGQCKGIVETLTHVPSPDAALTAEMLEFLPKGDFMAAVTVSLDSGRIERVAFYATQIPAGRMPVVGDRLTTFFAETPSYVARDVKVVAWSFGPGDGTYIKAERSYSGDVAAVFNHLGVLRSRDEQTDSALR